MLVSYTFDGGLTVGIELLWPLAVLPVAILVLAYVTLGGESGPRSASKRSRRLLFVSRVLVVTLLVLAAVGPYSVQTRETAGQPSVVLLEDESDSMAVYGNSTGPLVSAIEAEGVPVTRATIGSGTDSRIGDGITANLRENGTVVVASDGRVTGGQRLGAAAAEAQSLNATVSAVDIVPTETERAVTIVGPDTVIRGLQAEFTVSVDGVVTGGEVPVEVSVDGETAATEDLASNETLSVTERFNETGSHRVTATVTSDDQFEQNDVYYKSVRVVERPDVLYVSQGRYPFRNYLSSLYNVTNATSVPANLDQYSAVVVQDTPASRLGNVTDLQEYVINGGGLMVVGGERSYENGGYQQSPIASTLPVRVGNATGGASNIVLLVDISSSAEQGMAIQKAVSLDVLEQLGAENNVGIVAFNQNAYRIAELQPLESNRALLEDRIRRLESRGGTDIAFGLQGADELLGEREGTIILLSDGQDDLGPPAAVANQLGREGTRVVAVGAGRRVDEETMQQIARESGGTYLRATETNRLRLLFGGGSRQFQGENLTIVTRDTFITSGVELTANPGQANRVSVKSGADYQVATADGKPAIVSWRFGLGRVVSVTTYDSQGTLDGLLERPDSLVMTKSVNYAIGDPSRRETGVTSVGDARVGKRTTLTYRGSERPTAEGVSFSQVGEDRYQGEFTPREAGYGELLETEYAVNYPVEYARFGPSEELTDLVESTGGQTFQPSEGAEVARLARQKSTRIRTIRDSWSWLALLAALLVFTTEVAVRRVQVYRGRTSLESGLP